MLHSLLALTGGPVETCMNVSVASLEEFGFSGVSNTAYKLHATIAQTLELEVVHAAL